jgi:hypothetical protein
MAVEALAVLCLTAGLAFTVTGAPAAERRCAAYVVLCVVESFSIAPACRRLQGVDDVYKSGASSRGQRVVIRHPQKHTQRRAHTRLRLALPSGMSVLVLIPL